MGCITEDPFVHACKRGEETASTDIDKRLSMETRLIMNHIVSVSYRGKWKRIASSDDTKEDHPPGMFIRGCSHPAS